MAPKANNTTDTLMDWIRPSDVDGSLVGAVFSTYGLALDQPDFFGQDFLPTLLGLGGVRARGYASPVTLDRVLATADVSLICDAHAVGARRPTNSAHRCPSDRPQSASRQSDPDSPAEQHPSAGGFGKSDP